MNYDIWCFDFDGTIIDQNPRYYSVHAKLMNIFNGNVIENYIEYRKQGKSEKDLYEIMGVSPDITDEYNQLREKMLEEKEFLALDVLFPDIRKLLTIIKEKNRKIILLTNRSNSKLLYWELENLELVNFFDEIICTGIKPNIVDKISPKINLNNAKISKAKVLKRLSLDGRKVVMIGDSLSDIEASNIANVYGIGIITGFYDEKVMSSKSLITYKSISELYSHFKKSNCL